MATGNLKDDRNAASNFHSDASGRMPAMPLVRPGKILLVRFSALGDVIQTLPILTMLRDGFPDAKIGWAIDTELALADLDSVEKALNRAERAAKANDKEAMAKKPVLQKIAAGLNEGKSARSLGLDD